MNLPNKLSVIRIILVPVYIIIFYWKFPNWYIYATIVFAIACLTDLLDGYIARKYNLVTDLGKIMDTIADKVLVASALFLFLEAGYVHSLIVIILLGREFLISGFRTIAASKNLVIAAGALGKWKSVVQYFGIGFLTIQIGTGPILDADIGNILLYISAVLSIISAIEYFARNRQVLRETQTDKE